MYRYIFAGLWVGTREQKLCCGAVMAMSHNHAITLAKRETAAKFGPRGDVYVDVMFDEEYTQSVPHYA